MPNVQWLAPYLLVLSYTILSFAASSSAFANALLISPTGFDFGDVSFGATSPDQTVTITNVSGAPQTLNLAGGAAGEFGGQQNCQGKTLQLGESCQVTYAFKPTNFGSATGSTTLSVNGQPASFSFSGNGVAPFLISPLSFDFGNVAVNATSAPQTVTITNVSGAPQTLNLAGGAAGEFGGQQNCQGKTLQSGESCQVTYAFTPTATGTENGSTSLTVNGQSASFSFAGTGGTSNASPFLVSPRSFDFGDVAMGETSALQTVTITNVSGAPQTLNLAGGAAGEFGGQQNCQGKTLQSGESCQVTYAFKPTTFGSATGSTSLSINGQPVSFSFKGTGVDAFLISPIGFDFGEIDLGTTSLSQIVDILNVSDVDQLISMAGGAAGIFGGQQNCQGTTLAPGISCQISYAFTPTVLGPVTGSTTLNVNGQSAAFSFAGIGVNPQSSVPEPATLALLGLGLAGIGAMRRRG
jgi:uncharacterized Zn-binding protein involved in type VI secretion